MSIGKRIANLREEYGWKQYELAQKMDLNPAALNKIENGKRSIKEEEISKVAQIFGISTDTLLGVNTPRPGNRIPILGTVVAGQPAYAAENIVGWEEVTDKMSMQGKLFALKVKGSSMEPEFKEGDIVIVREQPDIESGDIAVVLINGDEATLKKVKKDPNGLFLYAFNQAVYEPHFYSNNDIETLPVRIVGRVIENRRSW
ncbi:MULTISPECIES: LexA family protein [Acidaminococcus]|jgi:repressor LexA|nr:MULTISPECIES: XRE family transcriptional regulator [Acidaminococcus]MCB7081964.1 XRE family transcriptional regulator [Acidaminococcus intestini]MDY2738918.1 XRE family transcriptional regulator [Acidaminococcus sp.]